MDVYVQDDELWSGFHSRRTQKHHLQHHYDDSFSWQMSHNEAARRGSSVVDHTIVYYLFDFHERTGSRFVSFIERLNQLRRDMTSSRRSLRKTLITILVSVIVDQAAIP